MVNDSYTVTLEIVVNDTYTVRLDKVVSDSYAVKLKIVVEMILMRLLDLVVNDSDFIRFLDKILSALTGSDF